jgi:hypothetical protein
MAATTSPSGFDFEIVDRMRELNDKMFSAAKQAGTVSLDSYERTLANLLDFRQKFVDSFKVEQFSEAAKAQAAIINSVSSAFVDTARILLK